jgi:ABC-type glutathione transport system ATPase component
MQGRIEFVDLSVRFSPGEPVLDIPRFELEQGKITVVAGRTGSGKSTLGHAAAGLLPYLGAYSSGTLHIGTETLPFDDTDSWKGIRGRLIRWIPQEPIRAFTISRPLLPQMLEGIENSEQITGKLDSMLERAVLPLSGQLAAMYPFEMSGGMLQRAALVSALLPEPMMVVADEPTAHLDPLRSLEIARTVTGLAEEASVALLWITHDMRMASALADRIVFLSDGRIVADGDPELLLDPDRENSLPIVRASARMALPQ